MADFDFSTFETTGAVGMDAIFTREEQVPRVARIRVASVDQLKGFQRLSKDTLINKSDRALWVLRREGSEVYIERQFDDHQVPIKG